MITETAINEFVAAVNAMLTKAYEGRTFGAMVEAKIGKKNVKIVKRDIFNGQVREGGSAFCFVELETGNILKAASWATPAKGIRGNIKNGAADLTQYGAVYFR